MVFSTSLSFYKSYFKNGCTVVYYIPCAEIITYRYLIVK